MALFSRRKRRQQEKALELEGADEQPDDGEDHDTGSPEAPSPDSPEEPAERPEHLADGPYDEADAPEEDRIDLGGIEVPTVDGLELRMEVDQRSGSVTGANLVIAGSSLQVQAFAAPKSRDRKSTRLNSSHVAISYAVFCLKKKKTTPSPTRIVSRRAM